MRYLFSPEGVRDMASLIKPGTLIGMDFDGTLAPIRQIPDDAWMEYGASAAFAKLARVARLAVISGRSAADVRSRLPMSPQSPQFVLGNHGLEGLPGTAPLCLQATQFCKEWLRQLHRTAEAWTDCPGVYIENKAYSLAIHYRLCLDQHRARQLIEEQIALLAPAPRMIKGHCVFNLLHPCAPDKGVALRTLVTLTECTNAVFIGDDETDEQAFKDAPRDWITVRVGWHPATLARYFIHSQPEIGALLNRLAGALTGERSHEMGAPTGTTE